MDYENSIVASQMPAERISVSVSIPQQTVDFEVPALWSLGKVCGIASELSKNMACMVWIWVVCVPQKRYRITTARWNSSGLLVGRVDPPPQSATTASSQSSSFDGSEEDTNTNINANGIDENLLPPALRGRTGPSKPPNRWILYRAAKSAELRADNPSMNASEISQVASLMWQAESAATKAEWEERAAEAREEHMRNTPEYAVAAGLRQRAIAERRRQRQQKKKQQEQQKGDGDKVAKETSTSTESLVTTDVGAVSNHGSSSSEVPVTSPHSPTLLSPASDSDCTPVGSPRARHGWGSDALSLMLDAAEFSTLF
uniref:MAT1-1-3a protein n=1 Tax=Pyricularia grisea TaxID=148305 RepID=Q86Z44_PYRGI|nr:MAT1-1-3a [Pyricularia grisea]BAC65089.2 MAT1-1-3a [Pyricularia grisea]BAC65093.2 MAT1-1-3a [Pyricularia grisea]